ncbi:uncharacterized protein C8A04DRAFT_27901 [Dichotomopilus funicola]|uniref:SDR family oxidoreductase n=1 Tax=Dichotomopilus funicola TaxID=1934379 RepID=A0AAN6ZN06_9PEZI|nr:hypothetical protein C8A04DRAFT_27901 [Dichotomopilus funicola]
MSPSTVPARILCVIGSGGMGLAVARRLGSGRTIFLADYSQANLDAATKALQDEGHTVEPHFVDVADFDAVQTFARAAAAAGHNETVVHTAGLSPSMAPAKRVFEVDLLGTVHVIDAFTDLIPAGSSLTCISSVSRFGLKPSPELIGHLAHAPRDKLLTTPSLLALEEGQGPNVYTDSTVAYQLSKRANYLRVQASVRAWGARGARINTVSPGVVLTALIRLEMAAFGDAVKNMIETQPVPRGGTSNDIAGVVAFLAGPDASYITGSDIVVDGGFMAANQGAYTMPERNEA